MQCACAIFSSVASRALLYFSTLNGTIFEKKKVIEHKMYVLIFSTVLPETFLIRRNERDDKKCILIFMLSTRYSCQILMKIQFSRQIFQKCKNIKFHENPSSGSRVVACGRTDRHDEVNSNFSQFCEGA